MKYVIILGESDYVTTELTENLIKNSDIYITLFFRNVDGIQPGNIRNCLLIEGDIMNYRLLKQAISFQDIVCVNLAGNIEATTLNIIKAMKETGINKVVFINSLCNCNESIKSVLLQFQAVMKGSGLEYRIIIPDWLKNSDNIDYVSEDKTAITMSSFITSLIESPQEYLFANLILES